MVFLGFALVCWLMLIGLAWVFPWLLVFVLLLPFGAYLSWRDRRRINRRYGRKVV